ncbi:MAG: SDR family NAD(P)-dependent oxidoreductase [Ignavibacteriae bacterium]|nr:SDR family NAD(P)-dependent oxidoreductase [Ignavibacteriota bacterium]
MNEDFDGKVILVSGASRGLGEALVLGFAKKKALVAFLSRDKGRLKNLSATLETIHAQYIYQAFDIRDEVAVKQFITEVTSQWKKIDVLANNASVLGPRADIASYPLSEWNDVLDINITGTFLLTKYVLPIMENQRSGSIINVSSSVGRAGRARWGAYAVSKFGIEGLTQVLADEVKHYGIRVNSVNPGKMATEMRRVAYPEEDQSKLKKPEDILDVFFYLASGQSKNVTGKQFDAQHFQV